MSYQVLARKYRPQKFSDVIGQEHVTRTLKNAIEQQRIAHGYIFSGHRGIGKTTIARILAMALNCRSTDHPVPEPCGVCDSCVEIRAGNAVDVIEIDAATNRGIDEIRELRDAARYRPARDRYKIWILDEAHQITDAAFNALLKTLEEPPSHVIFMMATTQPEDIPQTIRSRCQHFSFHAVSFDDIVGQLRDIAKQEGIAADDNALAMLAEAGDGSMRDALSIMDQAIASCGDTLSADVVRGLVGTVGSDILEDVMDAVARNSSEDVLRTIDRLLVEGQSAQHFARQMVRFLRNTPRGQGRRQRFARAADFLRRARPSLARRRTLQRRRPDALPADHAAHSFRSRLQAGAAFPPRTRLAEAGPRAAPASAGAIAERGSGESRQQLLRGVAELVFGICQCVSARAACRRRHAGPQPQNRLPSRGRRGVPLQRALAIRGRSQPQERAQGGNVAGSHECGSCASVGRAVADFASTPAAARSCASPSRSKIRQHRRSGELTPELARDAVLGSSGRCRPADAGAQSRVGRVERARPRSFREGGDVAGHGRRCSR